MTSSNTSLLILEAAEQLFAENGFAGTSMRQLTRMAGVNLAAVNYHFGTKENLIRAVFLRRLDSLFAERRTQLDTLIERHGHSTPPLRDVLRAFIDPALQLSVPGEHGQAPFVMVLARGYLEYHDELGALLSTRYGDLDRKFLKAMAANLPGVTQQQLRWRFDFVIGALTHTMVAPDTRKRSTDLGDQQYRERTIEELVCFAEAGMSRQSP